MAVFDDITRHLIGHSIQFRAVHHEPTHTSEASAKARGEDISVGGKAIVLKVDDKFMLFVLSAALKVDSQKIREHFKAKKTRFATPEELMHLTGLVPGSVPPFGKPFIDLDLYVDSSIARNDVIAFNAGSLTDSIIMSTKDYLSVAQPTMLDFSQG